MKIWYKLVEMKHGKLYTLFHGNDGTRRLEVGVWMGAVKKRVNDGTNGTPYISGWHVIATLPEARRYLKKFTADRDLRIVPCRARGITPKHHSRYDVHLARHLYIPEEVLNEHRRIS